MRLSELLIVVAFGVLLTYALIMGPFDSGFSFNPLDWVTDLIKGFLDLLKDLLFGWI